MGLGLLAWDRLPVWARRWRLISSGARKRRLQLTRGFSLRERVMVRGTCSLRVRGREIVLIDAIKGCVTAESLSCAI